MVTASPGSTSPGLAGLPNETTSPERVPFSQAHFHGRVDCDEAIFDEDTSFRDASFTGETSFRNITARGSSHEFDARHPLLATHFESAEDRSRSRLSVRRADTQVDDEARWSPACR